MICLLTKREISNNTNLIQNILCPPQTSSTVYWSVAKVVCLIIGWVLAIEEAMQMRWKGLTRGCHAAIKANLMPLNTHLETPLPLCRQTANLRQAVLHLPLQALSPPPTPFLQDLSSGSSLNVQLFSWWLLWTVNYICTRSCFPRMVNVTLTFLLRIHFSWDFHNPKQDSHLPPAFKMFCFSIILDRISLKKIALFADFYFHKYLQNDK